MSRQVVFDTISIVGNTIERTETMARMFYSYQDGDVYFITKKCGLELLMDEQAGDNGLLIIADEDVFEIVEYLNGVESGFTTKIRAKKAVPEPTPEPTLGDVMQEMEKTVNSFFDELNDVLEGLSKC